MNYLGREKRWSSGAWRRWTRKRGGRHREDEPGSGAAEKIHAAGVTVSAVLLALTPAAWPWWCARCATPT
jgi:hypothetical protein